MHALSGFRAAALIGLAAIALLSACGSGEYGTSTTTPAVGAQAPTESAGPTPQPSPWTSDELVASTVDALTRRDPRADYDEASIVVEEMTEGEAAARLPEGTANVTIVDESRPVLLMTLHGRFAAIATLNPQAPLVSGTWYRIVPLDRSSIESGFFVRDDGTAP